MKRLLSLTLFLAAVLGMLLPAAGPAETTTVTGYFTEAAIVHASPKAGNDMIGMISAYVSVTAEPVDSSWAVVTLEDGTSGYIYYAKMKAIPETTPCEPWYAYCEASVRLNTLPLYYASSQVYAEAEELLTVTGTCGDYFRIQLSGGSIAYIPQRLTLRAEFTPDSAQEISFFSSQEVPVWNMPLKGAGQVDTLRAQIVYTSSETCKGYYVLQTENGPGYVRKSDVSPVQDAQTSALFVYLPAGTVCYADESLTTAASTVSGASFESAELSGSSSLKLLSSGMYVAQENAEIYPASALSAQLYVSEDLPLLSKPQEDAVPSGTVLPGKTICTQEYSFGSYRILLYQDTWGVVPADSPLLTPISAQNESAVNASAFVTSSDADLLTADGTILSLPSDSTVFVYAAVGPLSRVGYQGKEGYVLSSCLQRVTADLLRQEIREKDLSGASVSKNAYLDSALPMLEETNAFLARYNLLTGSSLSAVLPLGIPYFWGGRSYGLVTDHAPEYRTLTAWQDSPSYFKKGTSYIYGLDCVGFVKAVCKLADHTVSCSLTDLDSASFHAGGHHIFCTENPIPDDWKSLAAALEPGDLLIARHPGLHAMMYIGTLRGFGYTEEQLPSLAEYLDYPVMIHCGGNPRYHTAFQQLISSSDNRSIAHADSTDGGVAIALLGVPMSQADYTVTDCGNLYHCFDVEGTCVTIFDFDAVNWYLWYRN